MEHRTFWTISLIVLIKLYMVIIVYLIMPMYLHLTCILLRESSCIFGNKFKVEKRIIVKRVLSFSAIKRNYS